jgi:hypothetical protein
MEDVTTLCSAFQIIHLEGFDYVRLSMKQKYMWTIYYGQMSVLHIFFPLSFHFLFYFPDGSADTYNERSFLQFDYIDDNVIG